MDDRPKRMEVLAENIPQELKQKDRWVIWCYKWKVKEKKWDKPPKDPKTGLAASSTNPKTWGSFHQAYDLYKKHPNAWDGIGYALEEEDAGGDFDHCRDPITGVISEPALSEIKALNSYTEVSPSHMGCKTLTKAKLPKGGHHKNGIGVFGIGRYFTVTGHIIEDVSPNIESRQEEVNKLIKKYWPDEFEEEDNPPPRSESPSIEDADLIEKIRRSAKSAKFNKLWSGDFSEYPSWSEADLALCDILAFWTGNDATQIDRLFRQSGLMRDSKWDEKHSGDGRTYAEMTIQQAIKGTSETYNPPGSEITSTSEEETEKQPTKETESKSIGCLLKYHLTDVGNAESFCELNGTDFIFIKEKKVWTKFDGLRWAEAKEEIKRKMIETMRLKSQIAMKVFPPDSDQMKHIVKWCLGSESNFRLSAAMEIATIYTTKSHNDFDNDPWLLACKNGVIDLRTGSIRKATPEDMLQKSTNLSFDERAVCVRWLQFLQEIFGSDEEIIDFIQRAVGYTLTGLTKEQCLFFLYGTGANGKSVFLSVLEGLLCEYGQTTSFSTFKEKKYDAIPNDIARIAGARMVKSVEIKEGSRLNEERIKALTGGDRMMARFLHNEFFEFDPIAKFWIAVNHKPIIRGTDEAIWRRIRLIPFEQTFPPEKRDQELSQKLKKELPGILNWAIEGCLQYQKMGLEPVNKIQNATEQYRAESDIMNQFLQDKIEKTNNQEDKIKAGDLYASYRKWCDENGEVTVTGTQFGKKMIEKGYGKKKDGHVYYLGVRFI